MCPQGGRHRKRAKELPKLWISRLSDETLLQRQQPISLTAQFSEEQMMKAKLETQGRHWRRRVSAPPNLPPVSLASEPNATKGRFPLPPSTMEEHV